MARVPETEREQSGNVVAPGTFSVASEATVTDGRFAPEGEIVGTEPMVTMPDEIVSAAESARVRDGIVPPFAISQPGR